MHMNKGLRVIICCLFLAFVVTACHRNPLDVNVSKIYLKLTVKRLDQDLFALTPENFKRTLPELQKAYGPFFDIYNREILAIGDARDSLYQKYLMTFLQDSVIRQTKLKSDSVFAGFGSVSASLELAFRHYWYYFPESPVPGVYTYLSGYNQSVVTAPGILGISLDNYLGSDCRFYRSLALPEYKRRNMNPQKIVSDAIYGFASQQFEYKGNTQNLISEMIYQGKLLYFLDAMIPDGEESLKIGYTKEQLKWCAENESSMWNYLIENKMLFSGDRMEVVRFINPAPFTTPFGQKSPGRTGVWLGWQIVKSYMKKNPRVTLRQLMAENDYHKILNDSGFSPD